MPISLRQMNSSNRSVSRGSCGAALGQRAHIHWVHGDEGGLYQLLLHLLIEAVSYRALPQVGSAVSGSSTPMALAAATASASSDEMAMKSMPAYCFTASMHGQPGPAGGQVDLLALPLHLIGAQDLLGGSRTAGPQTMSIMPLKSA